MSGLLDSVEYRQKRLGQEEEALMGVIRAQQELDVFARSVSVEELLLEGNAPWLVHELLPRAGVAVMFGNSGAGKTFAALDLASAVARGVAWFGNDVDEAGAVFYVAGEGRLGRRMRAHLEHRELLPRELRKLRVIPRAVNMLDERQVSALRAEVERLVAELGKPVLIVFDTLAACSAGSDEGRSDTGSVLEVCQTFASDFNCCVLLLHHPGWSNTERLRGSYALQGALDAVIRLERIGESSVRKLTAQKVRDAEERPIGEFELVQVTLGEDDRGRPISSCAVQQVELGTAPTPEAKARLTDEARVLYQCLGRVLDRSKRYAWPELLEKGARNGQTVATLHDVREEFYQAQAHVVDGAEDKTKAVDALRKKFDRALDKLQGAKKVSQHGNLKDKGVLWLL